MTRRATFRHFSGLGPAPLHRQLREVLTREIVAGRFAPGERIPSERDLCQTYQVSRTTVRQTINDLVHEGRLLRVPAKGTFVAPPKIEQDLARVNRFSETIRAAGRTPMVRIVESRRAVPTPPAQRALELATADEVVRIDVLGYADDDPLVLYRVHLPAQWGDTVAADLLRAHRAGTATFNMILERVSQVAGAAPAWAVQSYESAAATTRVAELLGVRAGDPVFTSTRTIFAADGTPLEYDEVVYRGDRYRFSIRRAYTLT